MRQRLDFVYDAKGRRVEKMVSDWNDKKEDYQESLQIGYAYDGLNLIGEFQKREKRSHWATYLWGLDISASFQGAGGIGGLLGITTTGAGGKGKQKEDLQNQLPFYDANGNVVGLVSSQRVDMIAQYVYGPFGELLRATGPAANGNPFQFSTKYADEESGLSYYGNRFYDPNVGRWLNRDSINELGFQLSCGKNSLNFLEENAVYTFVRNNPVDFSDPNGNEAITIGGGLCIAAGAFTPAGWVFIGGCCIAAAGGYAIGKYITREKEEESTTTNPRLGRWSCQAQCNVQVIGDTPNCPDRVTGSGTGSDQTSACLAAKRSATQSTPRGWYPRHCRCFSCTKS